MGQDNDVLHKAMGEQKRHLWWGDLVTLRNLCGSGGSSQKLRLKGHLKNWLAEVREDVSLSPGGQEV